MSEIKDSDLIVVIEDGRISQSGTHQELLASPGWYRNVFVLQAEVQSPEFLDTTAAGGIAGIAPAVLETRAVLAASARAPHVAAGEIENDSIHDEGPCNERGVLVGARSTE